MATCKSQHSDGENHIIILWMSSISAAEKESSDQNNYADTTIGMLGFTVNRQNFVESLIYRSHSLVAFRHRSDERNPPDVTASLIGHIPLLRSVIEVTSESPSP